MAKTLPVVIRDFTGGLTEAAPDAMANNELILAQNAVPDERAGLSKAKGTVRVNEVPFSPKPVEVLIEYGKSDGTIIPLAFSGTEMRKWDGTVIKDDLPGVPTDWDVYNDKLYWLDGSNFWVYDGETVKEVSKHSDGDDTTWAEVKTCHFIEQRGQRHFFAKKNKNDLYFSEIGNPNYIKATNVVKAITDDNDYITGLKEFGGALLVFKRDAIFGWFGFDPTTDVTFKRIAAHKGAISDKTIKYVESTLVYMADDGVYALTALYPELLSTVNLTDKKISNIIKKAKNKEKACAVYYQGAYRLSICTEGDVNNVEYRFYPHLSEKGAWFGPFSHPVATYLVRKDGKLYSGSPVDGLIFEHEVGYNYDNTPIHFKVITKPFDLSGLMVMISKIKRAFIAVRQYSEFTNNLNVTFKIDYSTKEFSIKADESMVWGKSVWGEAIWGWTDFVSKEMKIGLKGKRVQVTIENNNLDEPVTLYGLAFTGKAKKARASRLGVTEEASF